jgi:tetratricopeptide (TPR) repeat protein
MMGDPVQAKAEVQKAVDLAPELYHPYLGRGFVRQQYKEVDGALEDFGKAIALAPQLAEVHFAKANLLVGLGRYEDAKTTLLAAKPTCGEIPDWYVMLSLVQGTLKDPDGAMVTLNELIQRTPQRWEGYNLRGQLYASINQLDLAIADFDQASKLSPKSIEPRLNKFALLAAQKKTDEALAVLNQVLAENPDNLMALQMRMKFYEALGRSADALKDLERIEEIKKKNQPPPQ